MFQVDANLKKYAGNEGKLYKSLAIKYGPGGKGTPHPSAVKSLLKGLGAELVPDLGPGTGGAVGGAGGGIPGTETPPVKGVSRTLFSTPIGTPAAAKLGAKAVNTGAFNLNKAAVGGAKPVVKFGSFTSKTAAGGLGGGFAGLRTKTAPVGGNLFASKGATTNNAFVRPAAGTAFKPLEGGGIGGKPHEGKGEQPVQPSVQAVQAVQSNASVGAAAGAAASVSSGLDLRAKTEGANKGGGGKPFSFASAKLASAGKPASGLGKNKMGAGAANKVAPASTTATAPADRVKMKPLKKSGSVDQGLRAKTVPVGGSGGGGKCRGKCTPPIGVARSLGKHGGGRIEERPERCFFKHGSDAARHAEQGQGRGGAESLARQS